MPRKRPTRVAEVLARIEGIDGQKKREKAMIRGAAGGQYMRWRSLYDQEQSGARPIRRIK
jgi:hypothetical protein